MVSQLSTHPSFPLCRDFPVAGESLHDVIKFQLNKKIKVNSFVWKEV